MKKQFHFFVFILIATFIQSCVPEDSVTPDTGDIRDKFTGSWLFIETGKKRSVNVTYTVEISKDPSNSSQVLLSNFGNPGLGYDPAYGIATSGRITVPSQNTASDWRVEGSGTLTNAGKMDWTYSITAGGNKDTYLATATRQ